MKHIETMKYQGTEIIEYNKRFIKIRQIEYEPREIYLDRVYFILNKITEEVIKDNEKMELLEKESKIWANMKYLKCEY